MGYGWWRGLGASVFTLGLFALPSQAAAGPYYRLSPYPMEAQGGLAFDSTRIGAAVGGTFTFDYRLFHYNERFTFFGGVRAHATAGPLASGFGDAHHLALLAIGKFQFQVDSAQNWSPYIVLGAGVLNYAGHPRDDEPPSSGVGTGVGVEGSVGVTYLFSDRLGWYTDMGLVGGSPRAFYGRLSSGVQFNFGPKPEAIQAY